MFRILRRMPIFKWLALGQTVMLAWQHLQRLDANDRRRLGQIVRRGRHMSREERGELRRILGKLEPRAFAFTTAGRFSPLPLPRRFAGRSSRD
jgi:hypothetical protein